MKKPVVLVVMDGVGLGDTARRCSGESKHPQSLQSSGDLPPYKAQGTRHRSGTSYR